MLASPRARWAFACLGACFGVLFASACSAPAEGVASSSNSLSAEQPAAAALFEPTTKRISLEVDYVPGAEPYVRHDTAFDDPWKIFKDNAKAILDGKLEVVVPEGLAGMERLTDVDAKVFDQSDLVAIARKHRDGKSTQDTVSFYVVFLDGKFKDGSGNVSDNTVGVSVRGTGIIAMFKPAITTGYKNPASPVFMEQTTLVHEFGHSVGLVDDGLPETSPHRDASHGAHCSNPDCIMYWENSFVKDEVDFVSTYLTPHNGILFGAECLADSHALASQPGGHFASLLAHSSLATTAEPASLMVDE
jgi:hypothetical protein